MLCMFPLILTRLRKLFFWTLTCFASISIWPAPSLLLPELGQVFPVLLRKLCHFENRLAFVVRTETGEVMLRRILQMVRFRWQKSTSVGFVWLKCVVSIWIYRPVLVWVFMMGRAVYNTLRCGWVGFLLITTGSSHVGENIRYSVTA